jgi:hypothetical protein
VRLQGLRIFAQYGGLMSGGLMSDGLMSGLMSGIDPADFRNEEPIPSLWNCLNVSGIFGVIVQRLPQFANRYSKAAVKIHECIARPEAASEFLPADDLSGVFEQRDEEPMRLLLQPDASPVLQEFPRGGVYLKRAELIDNSGLCLHSWPPKS